MAGYSVTFSVVDDATKQIDAINRRIAQMRAPMERLSKQVTRFVDVSGLRKVASGFEWIAKTAGNVLRTLTAIVPVMGAITGAASIAGMVKLVGQYAAWSHELVAAADNIGTTTQQLQQFEDATRLAGGNAADMRDSLKGLHDNLADFNRGGASAAMTGQWANKLGINLKDANGHIRTATDLLPELLKRISALPDPADRAAAANALLGSSGDKLVETFRQSSKSFADWFTDVKRYKDLTDDQKQSLQRFGEAQGRLGVAFDRLGQQVSAMVAEHFGPLLTKFAEFVEKHTPDILKALDNLSTRFAAWLDSIKWEDVETGINKFIDSLKWVIDNLDTIKVAAEAIAALFVIKWGVGAVAAIAQVTSAIGSMTGAIGSVGGAAGAIEGAGAAAGVGLLGALGLVAGLVTATYLLLSKGLPAIFGDRPLPLARPPTGADANGEGGTPQATPNTARGGGSERHTERQPIRPGGSGHGGGPRVPADLTLPQATAERGGAITANIARDLNLPEAGAAGIVGNLQAESGLQAIQERNPISGRGGFGWAQWTGPRRVAFEKYARDNNLDPKSDAANYGYLMKELQTPEYAPMLAQLRDLKGPDAAKQAAAVFERMFERPAVSNAGVRGRYAEQALRHLPPKQPVVAAAPPVAVPPQQPVKGAVDVSITHKNPPPNSAVTATGSGAVNVAPVRVEQQDMASI